MMFFLEMQRNLKNTEKTLKIFRLRRTNNIRIAISNESQKNTSEDGADTEHRMESLSPKQYRESSKEESGSIVYFAW